MSRRERIYWTIVVSVYLTMASVAIHRHILNP